MEEMTSSSKNVSSKTNYRKSNGDNFMQWRLIVGVDLISRGKESHLTKHPPNLEIDCGKEMMCITTITF